jgi:hypothetical protein
VYVNTEVAMLRWSTKYDTVLQFHAFGLVAQRIDRIAQFVGAASESIVLPPGKKNGRTKSTLATPDQLLFSVKAYVNFPSDSLSRNPPTCAFVKYM